MQKLDQLFLVAVVMFFGDKFLQSYRKNNWTNKRLLDPKNREAILKACFYDRSVRNNQIKKLRKIETETTFLLKEGEPIADRFRLEHKECYARELRRAIELDEYSIKLQEMSPEERKLDNWDDF